MGGAVSSGVDNDDLVDRLANAGYIRTRLVERIFRAVDRGHYYTEIPPVYTEDEAYEADAERRKAAYRDMAWKNGLLHLSAPCVYSEVVEYLKLRPGQSFLNLGSGTGYLSTVVGLILGPYGINHGIEIHEEVVRYANWKLNEFKLSSDALYEFELCEPKFTIGNCLCLDSGVMQYDRVYCGAACPEAYENYMKNLLKVGGILVMPLNHQLLQITRLSETSWETVSVLPVSFASLILPSQSNAPNSKESNQCIKLPPLEPLGLQDSCRHLIRTLIRKKIECEHPTLSKRSYMRRMRQKNQKNNERLKSDRRHGNQSRMSEDSSGSGQSSRDGNDGCLRSLGLVVFRELEGIRNMDQVLTLIHVNRRLLGRETPRSAQGMLRRSFLRTAFQVEEERTPFGEEENIWVNELADFRDSSSSSTSSLTSTSSESSSSSDSDDDDGLELFLAEDGGQKESVSRNTTTSESSTEVTSSRDEDEICESKVKRLRLQNNERNSNTRCADASASGNSNMSSKKVRFKLPRSAKSARGAKCVPAKDEPKSNPSNLPSPSAPLSFVVDAEKSNASPVVKEPNVEDNQTQSEASCSEKVESMYCDPAPFVNPNENISDEDSVRDYHSSESEENFCFNCENKLGSCGEDEMKENEEAPSPLENICDENGDLEKEFGLDDIDDEKDVKDGITYPKLMCARIKSLPLPPMLKLYLNYQRPL